MDFQTIILRFRDLVTENGDTIAEHQEIIRDLGSVWWAWWRKGNEKLPIAEFSLLNTYAKNDGITVYLLDSGQKKLYCVDCNEIYLPKEEKESPERQKTPKYYNTQKYAAWFNFTSIKECACDEICKFSYVQVNNLFVDNNTNYSMFSDKRIHSLDELIQQNRTVWFVRDYHNTDADHEVILLNSNVAEPMDFSSRYFETKGNSLLWLSDLHFDTKPLFPVNKHSDINRVTLSDHILNSCRCFEDLCGLLISGDITNIGLDEGFAVAKQFIDDLNRTLPHSLSSENLIFCPGNHDFIRNAFKTPDKGPGYIYENPSIMKGYQEFYHSIHNKNPNKYLACGRKLLMASGQTVEIAALNSLILQQYLDFEGHGYLTRDQLDFVANNMGWNKYHDTNAIRIAMMHHHYLPTCFIENIDATKASSVVYDAELLREWMNKYNVRILLHGHKHQSFSSVVGFAEDKNRVFDYSSYKQTYIIGMGGTGAQKCDNMYAVIRFLINEIKIEFYRVYSDNISKDVLDHTIIIPLNKYV